MKVCFLSNYLTHHQLPFCLEMVELTGGEFVFVETEQLPDERRNMGYVQLGQQVDFVIPAWESPEAQALARKTAMDADVTIIGSAPDSYIRQRLKENKLTFRYSERIFKKGYLDVLRQGKYLLKTFPYRNKNLYYLFSSAYAAHDYSRCGAKAEKMFKWGYFPEHTVRDDKAAFFAEKEENTILWAGRLIDWKHPEAALEVARRLKAEGIPFRLNFIGTGPMEQTLREQIQANGLSEQVTLLGAMPPEKVRRHMEESQIYLFTSDYNEGWGAVTNEAMSSGCAMVASHACGSVPFMIKPGENGHVYESGNVDQLFAFTKELLLDSKKCRQMGENALKTMDAQWNAKVAAKRFVDLCSSFRLESPLQTIEKEGPMSPAAPICQDKMYAYLKK